MKHVASRFRVASVLFMAGVLLFLTVTEHALAEPLPVATFFQRAKYGGASLSPSGKYLAVLTPANDRRNLAIVDLETRAAKMLTSGNAADVLQVVWLSDERLVFTVGDLQIGSGEPPRYSGIVAIDRDGADPRSINKSFSRPLRVGLLRGITGSDEIFVTASDRSRDHQDIYRFDTRKGTKSLLSFDTPGNVQEWKLDFDNIPRAIVTADLKNDRSAWYVRKGPDSPWQLVREAKLGALKSAPLAFSADGKILYVQSREDRDRTAIHEYDIDSGKWGLPIVQHPERDVDATFRLDIRNRKLLGFAYADDTPSYVWFDADYARMQKSIDAVLPRTVNSIQKSSEGSRWVVVATSDRDPGSAYLLDGKTMKLERLFEFAPWFKPAEMAETKWISYKARDGLTIPALLTVPMGAQGKRVPLVVNIHGGPYVPATRWGFAVDVQFMASRGYAVLQPQFRGTDGFGWKHFASGFRKWGDEMQDDLEDGVKWAVDQGIADAGRVCFYGASYGGYAAMWGSIKNAGLIKCAVAFVGVSSIDYLFDNARTDMAEYIDKSSEAVVRIGDPKTERARFKRVNPLDNADKVGVPLLLAYGAEDLRVPLVHGTDFKSALDKHGKPYEWVVYEGEGHGFNKTKNLIDFYTRVENFLAKHLNAKPPESR